MLISISIFASPSYTAGKTGNQYIAGILHLPYIETLYIKDITRWREDMNFLFDWQEQYVTSERNERLRYCSCHENIKFISSSQRVTSGVFSVKHQCLYNKLRLFMLTVTYIHVILQVNISTFRQQLKLRAKNTVTHFSWNGGWKRPVHKSVRW